MTDNVERQMSARRMPASAWLFIATGVVFLAQIFPFTGIFLMIMLAPFWSVVLVNVGFILMFIEAIARVTPRWLIVPPIIWFAGYAVVAVISHHKASELTRQIDEQNRAAGMVWDHASYNILVVPGAATTNALIDPIADGLVERYGLNKVFVHNETFRGISEDGRVEIVSSPCPPWMNRYHDQSNILYYNVVDRVVSDHRPFPHYVAATEICKVVSHHRPSGRVIKVVSERNLQKNDLFIRATISPITISNMKVRSRVLAVSVSPVSWYPMPVIGCTLIDSTSTWKCGAQFWHTRDQKSDNERNKLAVVARALGLTERTLTTRFPDAGWR